MAHFGTRNFAAVKHSQTQLEADDVRTGEGFRHGRFQWRCYAVVLGTLASLKCSQSVISITANRIQGGQFDLGRTSEAILEHGGVAHVSHAPFSGRRSNWITLVQIVRDRLRSSIMTRISERLSLTREEKFVALVHLYAELRLPFDAALDAAEADLFARSEQRRERDRTALRDEF